MKWSISDVCRSIDNCRWETTPASETISKSAKQLPSPIALGHLFLLLPPKLCLNSNLLPFPLFLPALLTVSLIRLHVAAEATPPPINGNRRLRSFEIQVMIPSGYDGIEDFKLNFSIYPLVTLWMAEITVIAQGTDLRKRTVEKKKKIT